MTLQFPPEAELLLPSDTAADRLRASGVPHPGWSWDSFPPAARGAVYDTLRDWSAAESPGLYGVVLRGHAGLGKTGLACCVVRDAAERRVGSNACWMAVTAPGAVAAVDSGDFRRRPAPAQFYRWRDLKSLLDRAKVGQLPWDEMPVLTAEKIFDEIESRCRVVVLDDIDVDNLTPWKEEILLRLIDDLPHRRCRLLVTLNSPSSVIADRLGDRIVDRLMDSDVFGDFSLTGESFRRRHVG